MSKELTKKKSGFFSRSNKSIKASAVPQIPEPLDTNPSLIQGQNQHKAAQPLASPGISSIISPTAAVVDSYAKSNTSSPNASPQLVNMPTPSGSASEKSPPKKTLNPLSSLFGSSKSHQVTQQPPSQPPPDVIKPPPVQLPVITENPAPAQKIITQPIPPQRQTSTNVLPSPPAAANAKDRMYDTVPPAKPVDILSGSKRPTISSATLGPYIPYSSKSSALAGAASILNKKKRELYGVRVILPRDITTIILCDEKTTVGELTAKALDKLRLILGLRFDPYHVLLTLPHDDKNGLDNDLFVAEIHNFKENPNTQPTFKIVYNYDNSKQYEDDSESLQAETPPEEKIHHMETMELHAMAGSAPDQFISGLANRFGSLDYPPSSAKSTDDGSDSFAGIRSRTASDAQTSFNESSGPSYDVTVDRKGMVSIADIIGVTGLDQDENADASPTKNKKTKMQNNKQRKFRPSTMYAVKYVKAQAFQVEFQFPNIKNKVSLEVIGDSTISQIKEDLWEHPKLPSGLEQMEYYHFHYVSPDGHSVELFDEQQLFHTISVIKYWQTRNMPFAFQVESKQKQVNKQMQALSKKIGFIIGYGLYRFDYLRDAEVDIFRRKMVSVRQNAVRTRDLNVYNFRPEVEARSASQKVMEKIGSSGKIQYRLTVPSSQLTKTLHFQYDETPERVIAGFLPKNNRFYLPETAKPEDLVLKVSGRAEYLVGNYKMIDFSYIRRCVMRDEKISLILVFAKDIQQSNSQPIPEEFDPIEDPTANMGSHSQLTIQGRTEAQIRTISLWDIARSYRVQITACENLNVGAIEAVYVEVGLYHGGRLLCPPLKTHQVHASRSPRWGAWLNFDLACYNLPRTARMCITVWGRWNAKKKMSQDKENDIYPLGWVNMLLMDYKGYLKSGLTKLALWPGEKANPIGTCVSLQNFDEASIYVRLDSFAHPVIFPTETYSDEYKTKALVVEPIPESVRPTIETVLASDPLVQITPESARAVWKYRYNVMHRPEALPKVLLSARSEMLDEVQEVKKLLKAWAPMPPEAALELLDSNFADMDVRAYAVTRLELLADDRVLDYLLQLVQALKYEPYLDCALGSFLLKRALRNRSVGHYFFWYLKSEMEDPTVSLRFALLMEAYLRGCGVFMDDFAKQTDVLTRLSDVATAIKRVKTASERKEVLTSEIARMNLPTTFQIALDPKMEAKGLIQEKCKYMDSKKLPLWLVFDNADPTGTPTYVIFKSGDDLRQDMLTLQMIRIMDKLWQADGLDLRMVPYGVLATGNGIGFIEVVLNAETVSSIQIAYGGSSAAFRDQPLEEWLRKQNPDDSDYTKAVETFTLSCAGYCVATYVLGIGDRHNDNIMVTKDGHLFHIDFGHFLGNIKKKFGFKRERAPFVLTPDFVYVMGKREGKDGEQFKRFIEYCVQAFLILRRRANMFINFFAMMLSTGIPELKSADDIHYLRDALCLGKTEEQAALEFRNLIFESLRLGWSTQLNWWLHNLAHAK